MKSYLCDIVYRLLPETIKKAFYSLTQKNMQQLDGSRQVIRLGRLTNRSRRLNLQQTMVEFIAEQQEDGYRFADILQSASTYCIEASGEIAEEKPTWEMVASVLELSGLMLLALERPAIRNRRVAQENFSQLVAGLQQNSYNFAEILQSLADYCLSANANAKKKRTLEIVSSMLEMASLQAQVEDRELP